MVKLLVRASTNPVVRLEPGRVAVQANGTVTAYAIQANGTLTPLFMLNLVKASRQPNNKWAAFVQFWFWGKEENLQKKPGDLRPHLASFLFLAGDGHQRPGGPQRDEVSCSCDPQQVSHAVKKKCSSERIIEGVKRSQSDFLGFFLRQNVSDPGHQLCWRFSGESSFFIVIIHSFICLFGTEPRRKDPFWTLFSISSKPIFWLTDLWPLPHSTHL